MPIRLTSEIRQYCLNVVTGDSGEFYSIGRVVIDLQEDIKKFCTKELNTRCAELFINLSHYIAS